jgi:hypothetical protein
MKMNSWNSNTYFKVGIGKMVPAASQNRQAEPAAGREIPQPRVHV